jgi:hypothetical protein
MIIIALAVAVATTAYLSRWSGDAAPRTEVILELRHGQRLVDFGAPPGFSGDWIREGRYRVVVRAQEQTLVSIDADLVAVSAEGQAATEFVVNGFPMTADEAAAWVEAAIGPLQLHGGPAEGSALRRLNAWRAQEGNAPGERRPCNFGSRSDPPIDVTIRPSFDPARPWFIGLDSMLD